MGGWDHHWNLKSGYENYLPQVDMLVSALFTDLAERGLLDKVLVVMCGEFSRTPRMNNGGNGGPAGSMGTPGRDHWGNAMFCLMGGGGIQGGRIVGSHQPPGRSAQGPPARMLRPPRHDLPRAGRRPHNQLPQPRRPPRARDRPRGSDWGVVVGARLACRHFQSATFSGSASR